MTWQRTALLGLLCGASFSLGQWLPAALRGPELQAQGRGPVNPAPPPPAPADQPTSSSASPSVVPIDGGQSSAGGGFLAVTGSYGVGTSVLYLVDTVSRQLAVYEARGGGLDQRRIVFVGARKIDLDLQLEGYNDRSEYDYRKLRGVFEKRGSDDHDYGTGLETGAGKR